MELSDWRTIGGVGIWPMGVKGAHKWGSNTNENDLLWERPCLFGTRIKNDKVGEGRPIEGEDALGHYVEDPFWRGDLIGGTHWQRNTRDIGAWRWSWPVTIGEYIPPPMQLSSQSMSTFSPLTGGGFTITQANLPTGQQSQTPQGVYEHYLQPIKRINPYSGEYEADDRFTSITAKMPKDDTAGDIWPWFPKGWIGIMEGADWEDDQQELFHPTDPRIMAVHKESPWEMGSWMCDIKKESVDPERHASVQSMFWVIQRPKCNDVNFGFASDSNGVPNTIAWNIGGSGQGDHRGGLMIDTDSRFKGEGMVATGSGGSNLDPNSSFNSSKYSGTTTSDGGGGPLGFISQRQSGPIEIPCTKFGPSSHHMGTDGDGNDIYAAHLSMNSYFTFPGGVMDGPLMHDGPYIPPDEAPELTHVWFGYDAQMPHPFIGGQRKGKHRWWCSTNKYAPPCSPPGNPTVGNAPGFGRTGEGGPGAAFMDAPLMTQGSPQGALSETYMAEWTLSLLGGDSPFAYNGMSLPQYGQANEDPWWENWWNSYQDTLMDVGETVEEWRNKLPGAKTIGDAVEDFWKTVAKKAFRAGEKAGEKLKGNGKKKFGNFPTAGEIWEGIKDVMTGQEPLLPDKKKGPLTWSIFDLYKELWEQAKKLAKKFDQDGPPQQPPPNGPGEGHGFEGDTPLDPGAFRKPKKTPAKKTPQNPPKKKKNPGGGGGGGGGCGGSNQYAQKVGPYSMSEQRGFLPYQFSSMEEGGLAYIWRPQRFQSREIDWKKWTKPNRSYRGYTADSFSPITCRFEAYGAQGARNDASDSPLDKATPWVYTHKPQTYRYMSGTANGGVVMTSPEVDLADWDTGLAPVTGAAQSTTHFIAGRGTRFGAGLPDLFLGGIEEGFSWYDDGSGGLTFSTNAESTATERVLFDVAGCVGIGGDSYGGSLGSVVFIANASRAPVSNPTGGGILYVTGGALTYRGSSGTVTTLAPA